MANEQHPPAKKVYSKYMKRAPGEEEYDFGASLIPLGGDVYVRVQMSDGQTRVSIDRWRSRIDIDGRRRWESLGKEARANRASEGQGAFLTVREWEGLKAVLSAFETPKSRKFVAEQLPLTTEHWDPSLPLYEKFGCFHIVNDPARNGAVVFIICRGKYTTDCKWWFVYRLP